MNRGWLFILCSVHFIILCSANEKTIKDNKKVKNTHPVNTTTDVKQQPVHLNSGDSVSVCNEIPWDVHIDSISTAHNKIDGVLSFSMHRKIDISRFNISEKVFTEYSQYIKSSNRFSFISKNDDFKISGSKKSLDSLNKYHIVTADITILTMYSNGYKICSILHLDSISPTVLKYRSSLLSFDDGTSLSVSSHFYSDIKADSLVISRKSFSGTFKGCGKGGLSIRDYGLLKLSNPEEYNSIKEITTAFNIINNEKEYYFSGKNSDWCKIENGRNVTVKALILSLFSKGKILSNVLIIDSID